jgi:hypothetical protein
MTFARIPDHIVYRKSGFFADEPLDAILERKRQEHRRAGYFFWGYGGTLCHPSTQIRPFVQQVIRNGEKPYLVMSYTNSELRQEPKPATQFSIDKRTWLPLPVGINVYGSRFAVICGEPHQCALPLDFQSFVVAIGDSINCPLHKYIRHRVDKACAQRNLEQSGTVLSGAQTTIFWIAEIVEPYAVFLQ